MLALTQKGPWNTPTKRSGRAVVNEEFRQYWIAPTTATRASASSSQTWGTVNLTV